MQRASSFNSLVSFAAPTNSESGESVSKREIIKKKLINHFDLPSDRWYITGQQHHHQWCASSLHNPLWLTGNIGNISIIAEREHWERKVDTIKGLPVWFTLCFAASAFASDSCCLTREGPNSNITFDFWLKEREDSTHRERRLRGGIFWFPGSMSLVTDDDCYNTVVVCIGP